MNETPDPVATVGQSLGASAYPVTLTWGNQKLHLQAPTLQSLSKVEAEVARRIMNVPEKIKDILTEHQYQRELSAARLAIAANKHKFGGSHYMEIVSGSEGIPIYLWSHIVEDVSIEAVEQLIRDIPDQALSAYATLVPDFLLVAAQAAGAKNQEQIAAVIQKSRAELGKILEKARSKVKPVEESASTPS